jgi:hypothetical protein
MGSPDAPIRPKTRRARLAALVAAAAALAAVVPEGGAAGRAATVRPDPPSGLALTGVARGSFSIRWDAGSQSGVRYAINRDGILIDSTVRRRTTLWGPGLRNELLGRRQRFVEFRSTVSPVDAGRGHRAVHTHSRNATRPQGSHGSDRLTVTATSQSGITLAWNTSRDNDAVIGYGLYRGGEGIGSCCNLSFAFSGLSCGTTYALSVDAFEAAGKSLEDDDGRCQQEPLRGGGHRRADGADGAVHRREDAHERKAHLALVHGKHRRRRIRAVPGRSSCRLRGRSFSRI